MVFALFSSHSLESEISVRTIALASDNYRVGNIMSAEDQCCELHSCFINHIYTCAKYIPFGLRLVIILSNIKDVHRCAVYSISRLISEANMLK